MSQNAVIGAMRKLRHYNSELAAIGPALAAWPPKEIVFLKEGTVYIQNLSTTLAIQVYSSVKENQYITLNALMGADFGQGVRLDRIWVRSVTGSVPFEIQVASEN